MRILVLGIGNSLMSDDAFGVLVVQQLQKDYCFPEQVELLDGGTLGLDLLPRLEGIDQLLILDAINMDGSPGDLFRLEGEDVPRAFANKLSVHQMGVQDLLAVAELQGHCPSELVVWGVQPDSVEMRIGLTEAVVPALPKVVQRVIDELTAWGAGPLPA